MNAAQRLQFEQDLARIVRRANRLRAALNSSADVVAVPVKECTVPEHTRGEHTRYVIKKRPTGRDKSAITPNSSRNKKGKRK